MFTRTRRLRSSKALRDMVRNVTINLSDFIYPLFIEEGENLKEEISSMPGQYRWSIDRVGEGLAELKELGITSICFLVFLSTKTPKVQKHIMIKGLFKKL